MKLHQLEIFRAIAEEKSLRGAARKLNLTQPAVTRVAQELESELGVRLLARSSQGVELTRYGQSLGERATRLLEEVRRTREEIDQMKGDLGGKVKVGVTPSIAQVILPQAMQRFRALAPDAELTFTEVRYPVTDIFAQDPATDFVVCHVTPQMLDDSVTGIALFATEFLVLARRGHRLASARHLSELMDEVWVATNPGGTFQQLFESAGLPVPRRIVRSSSFAVTLALVAGTDTLGFFSDRLVSRIADLGVVQVPVEDKRPRMQMSIVTRKEGLLTPVAQHFIACLQEASKQIAHGAV